MFSRLSLPTPFRVGPVNAYVAGRTLVDPGPDSEEAWSTLLDGLEARDLTPGDVERVLVTHPHPDHFGTAARLRDAGAEVVASGPAAEVMADFEGRLDYEQSFFRDFFERCGMAASTAKTTTDLPQVFVEYAPDVETDRTVGTGDRLEVAGRTLEVRAVTGHATGELCFSVAAEDEPRTALVGDHVLPGHTPNPFLQPPPARDGERPRMVVEYNRSLEALREESFARFLPGHGEPISDPAGRIDEILAAHERRTGEVLSLLDGPTTPVEVMEGLFGDLPVTERFSGMSEAVGHLEVLEDRGKVTVSERGGLLVYEPVEPS